MNLRSHVSVVCLISEECVSGLCLKSQKSVSWSRSSSYVSGVCFMSREGVSEMYLRGPHECFSVICFVRQECVSWIQKFVSGICFRRASQECVSALRLRSVFGSASHGSGVCRMPQEFMSCLRVVPHMSLRFQECVSGECLMFQE